MKEVIIKDNNQVFDDLEQLVQHCNTNNLCLGFQWETTKNKYLIILNGDYRGAAVNGHGNLTNREYQKDTPGKYFMFQDEEELFDWMLE